MEGEREEEDGGEEEDSGGEEDEEDRDRTEDEEVEDETGREWCFLQRGAETDSDGWRCFQMFPDDWRTTADEIRRQERGDLEEHLVGKEKRRLGGEGGSVGG